MDLYVVVGIIGVKDRVNGNLQHDAAFLYLYIMALLPAGYRQKILHGLAELVVADRLYHVIQSTDLISLQGKIGAAGSEHDGTGIIIPADPFSDSDTGGLIPEKNIYEYKVKAASLPAAKEVGGGIEDGRLLAGMCVGAIGGYKAG